MESYHGKEWGAESKMTVKGTPPSKSNSYRIIRLGNRSSLAKTKQTKDYEAEFKKQLDGMFKDIIGTEFEFFMNVYYPNKRSDLDGSFKVTLDCLQKQVNAITNDNLCIRIVANKFIDKLNPRIEFKLREYEH